MGVILATTGYTHQDEDGKDCQGRSHEASLKMGLLCMVLGDKGESGRHSFTYSLSQLPSLPTLLQSLCGDDVQAESISAQRCSGEQLYSGEKTSSMGPKNSPKRQSD